MILMTLPLIVLFVVSLAGYLGSELIKGSYSKRYIKNSIDSYKYTALVSGICAVAIVLLSGFTFPFSWFSVGLGLLFGIAVTGLICVSSMAIKNGPFSYTLVMISLAIIVPAFSGAIFWGETLTWLDFVGLAFMIFCFVLSVQKQTGEQKGNGKWLFLSIVAMIFMAGVGLLQKTHQSSVHKDEITVFLTTAFTFSCLCSTVIYLILKGLNKQQQNVEKVFGTTKSVLLQLVAAGIATSLNHTINLYLSGSLDSILFFPVMCGCELIGITLVSLLFFKERLTKRQWIGIACGAIAVLMLCI